MTAWLVALFFFSKID
jgi:hypothetical protein